MDQQAIMDVANVVTKLKMYPYFDICNYILMCLIVREDTLPASGSQLFSRKHPLACWVSSMLLCFAGSFLANFLIGESLLLPLKNHQDVLLASAVWYVINYSPFDLVYKIVKFLPFKLVIYLLKEVQRVHKVHHAVVFASKLYPGSYLIIVAIGVLKGTGSGHMRVISRLVCGIWDPKMNELNAPSFATKGCLLASIVFICERKGMIEVPHALLYLGVVVFFVLFRITSLLLGMGDPFVPFENLFCAIFMGGVWDAMKRALSREKKPEDAAHNHHIHNDVTKTKEEKKKD